MNARYTAAPQEQEQNRDQTAQQERSASTKAYKDKQANRVKKTDGRSRSGEQFTELTLTDGSTL